MTKSSPANRPGPCRRDRPASRGHRQPARPDRPPTGSVPAAARRRRSPFSNCSVSRPPTWSHIRFAAANSPRRKSSTARLVAVGQIPAHVAGRDRIDDGGGTVDVAGFDERFADVRPKHLDSEPLRLRSDVRAGESILASQSSSSTVLRRTYSVTAGCGSTRNRSWASARQTSSATSSGVRTPS